MVTDLFNSLLQELSQLLHITKLQADSNNSCLLAFPKKPPIQLEMDKSGQYLNIGCDLGIVPPGRFRENVFREALKTNGLPPPRNGDFSYSQRKDSLILMESLPAKNLNGDKIMAALIPFLEKATLWQESIGKGEVPTSVQATYAGKGMFGLR